MMTRRTRITIVLLVFVALLLFLFWFLRFLFSQGEEFVVEETPVVEVVEETEVIPDRPTISDQELEEEREERNGSYDVVSASKSFVTRYGSYSNEADFQNLVDVLPLMSESFAAETEDFIESAEVPEEYYGVSTSVITVSVDEKDEDAGVATVAMTTQREEAIGSPQNISVKYQDIILTFVKEEGEWKVDSAVWQ